MDTKEEANLGWDDFPCSSSSPPDRYVSSWRPWGDNNRFCSGGDLSHCVDSVTDGWTEFNPCSNGELEEAFEEDESDHKVFFSSSFESQSVLLCEMLELSVFMKTEIIACEILGICFFFV